MRVAGPWRVKSAGDAREVGASCPGVHMDQRSARIRTTIEILIIAVVLTASLVLRLVGLDAFVVNDEMRWTCRSIGFQEALSRGDWASTFRTGHPGVITTWLGTLSIPLDAADAEAREACQITPAASKLSESGDSPEERTELMHRVQDLLFKARRGVALFTWLSFVGIYLLTRHLWGVRVAVLSLVFMAIDPFYLALSRILHVDGALTSTMMLSVLGLIAALRHRGKRWKHVGFLVLSGVMTGLAILQKSPAMFLGPFSVLLVGVDVLRRGARREVVLRALLDLAIVGCVAVAVYVALWPTMWVQPVETMRRVLEMALGYAAEGHSSGNYFLGQPSEDPGWLFYPIATPFRFSPVALIGLTASVIWLFARKGTMDERRSTSDLLIYAVAFGAFMTLGDKMFDRYLVPVYPALEIAAAVGIWWMVDGVRHRLSGAYAGLLSPLPIAMVTFAVQLVITLPHYPHYLTYYNPLLGGIHQAKKILLVGWGEGYEQAAAYLNAKPNAEELQVNMPAFPVFAPQFDGSTRSMEKYSDWGSDYVMFYLSHVQRQRYGDLMTQYLYNPRVAPEKVFSLHGVDYIWLYHNDHYRGPLAYVEQHGRPDEGECILANGDSLFVKYYEGDHRLLTFKAYWDTDEDVYTFWRRDQLARLLNLAPDGCERIWYLSYPEQEDEDYLKVLQARSIEVDRALFGPASMSLHKLMDPTDKQEVDLRFGDLQLRSFGETEPTAAWGRDGGLVLTWEAAEPIEEDYSTFLHLYNAHGQRIALGDALITDENLQPTSQWQVGAQKPAVYHLSIPPETPPGDYRLALGVYLLETGERLPLVSADGNPGEKSVTFDVTVGVPDTPPEVADLPISELTDEPMIPELKLLGHTQEHRQVLTGEAIPIRLFWEAVSPMERDYRLRLSLRDETTVHAEENYDMVTTYHPTSAWERDERLGEWYYLPTDADMPTGEMSLEVNLLDEAGDPVLAEPVQVSEIWIQSREPSFELPREMGERTEVTLGETISLLGCDTVSSVKPGEDLEITLTWQALAETEVSYKVFVHLYDHQGGILGQLDRRPGLGARPTNTWQEGEILTERYIIPVPPETEAGTYPLAVGMYDPETGERLTTVGPRDQLLERDRVSLGAVEVIP